VTILASSPVAAPHLLDSEVVSVLRRLVLAGTLTEREGRAALDDFGDLHLERYGAGPLRPRMWELRHDVSAYDATYVALAEALDVPLLTTDGRLASAPGIRCSVEVA
jgi:predicted nucleic acid-binding protein